VDELKGLVEARVLEQHEVSGQMIFMLANDPETRDMIRRFVLACDDRVFRVKAIYHVIRGMR
jgi:hypothetical protein